MTRRLFIALCTMLFFVLALLLRCLHDAHPMGGAQFFGQEFWTYKASVPVGVFSASLFLLSLAFNSLLYGLWRRQNFVLYGKIALVLGGCACAQLALLAGLSREAIFPPTWTGAGQGLCMIALFLGTGIMAFGACRQLSYIIRSYGQARVASWRAGVAGLLTLLSTLAMLLLCVYGIVPQHEAWSLGQSTLYSYMLTLGVDVFLVAYALYAYQIFIKK